MVLFITVCNLDSYEKGQEQLAVKKTHELDLTGMYQFPAA